jgi:hypothetical protein
MSDKIEQHVSVLGAAERIGMCEDEVVSR